MTLQRQAPIGTRRESDGLENALQHGCHSDKHYGNGGTVGVGVFEGGEGDVKKEFVG